MKEQSYIVSYHINPESILESSENGTLPTVSRTPPRAVLEKLRREVNFGCPVADCGEPYLTWHHFDPPWEEQRHHNPEGMIAVCSNHAAQADRGGDRWTREQILEMKKNPFVTEDKISNYYGYLRKNVVCRIGNLAYGVRNILEIGGERVIGFEVDETGYSRLNLLIRDTEGKPILVMENNFWTAVTSELYDLRCSARGKELEIISNDGFTRLKIRFDDIPLDKFRKDLLASMRKITLPSWVDDFTREMMKSMPDMGATMVDSFLNDIGRPAEVPVWTVLGDLRWKNRFLQIRESEAKIDSNILGMNFITGTGAALVIDETSTVIGRN